MGGGLMQLVAYGAQDIYLTGNPQITFFKVVYRRHTNFSMESIQQTFSGSGKSVVATISRNGDLVHKMYLCQTGTLGADYSDTQPITTVELEIGGQRIDRQSGQWMDTWNELSTPESKAIGLKAMTGQIGTVTTTSDGTGVDHVHIPLQFWFCRNPGLALPLIALQYHEVKVKFELASSQSDTKFELYCDYIYLDTDERRRFAQVSHEYLIEQVQEQSTASTGSNKLNFNHPVKELIWSTTTKAATVGLKLNGHDRFSTRNDEYFYLQQPYDYHTAVPRQNLPDAAQLTSNMLNRGVVSGTEAIGGGTGSLTQLQSVALGSTITEATILTGKAMVGLSSAAIEGSTDLAAALTVGVGGGSPAVNNTSPANKVPLLLLTSDVVKTGLIADNIGQLFEITGQGLGFLGAGATTPATHNVRLTGVKAGGAEASGTSNTVKAALITAVVFDKNLFKANSAATDGTGDQAGEFTITSIRILNAATELVSQARTSQDIRPIGVYSFALKPEEHQPSGTCNFSRIDNAELTLGGTPGSGNIYAVNYNVLRIMSGMGGLAYSN